MNIVSDWVPFSSDKVDGAAYRRIGRYMEIKLYVSHETHPEDPQPSFAIPSGFDQSMTPSTTGITVKCIDPTDLGFPDGNKSWMVVTKNIYEIEGWEPDTLYFPDESSVKDK